MNLPLHCFLQAPQVTFGVKVELTFVTCVIVPIGEKFTATNMTRIPLALYCLDRTGCCKNKWVFVVNRVLDFAGWLYT